MVKVTERVPGKVQRMQRDALPGRASSNATLTNTSRVLETKVSIATGFQELRDMNRKALISLKL
ncbi:hypothetical protein H1230_30180 [Paenibacillus sp. 19GGS1-52]|uniref:hypothetical protein n=1 Tax=Paenibacillus sp. 19GGS1-52 TaxID=2758563 RepID=UPI001EFBF29C|nr:hypothetical protein [Paenibacillus sp. 19GGS1-52]ULO07157.1 hypothetical protein H1230_30180 [Paenibacillus sp. 19GGS1-52]